VQHEYKFWILNANVRRREHTQLGYENPDRETDDIKRDKRIPPKYSKSQIGPFKIMRTRE